MAPGPLPKTKPWAVSRARGTSRLALPPLPVLRRTTPFGNHLLCSCLSALIDHPLFGNYLGNVAKGPSRDVGCWARGVHYALGSFQLSLVRIMGQDSSICDTSHARIWLRFALTVERGLLSSNIINPGSPLLPLFI